MGLLTLFVGQLALAFGLTESGAGLLGECPNLRPELLPGGTLLDGKRGKFIVVAHLGQVGILLPLLQVIDNADRKKGILLEETGTRGQVGLEPLEGLLTQVSLFLEVELVGPNTLAGGGQGRGTGRVIAIALV